MLARTLPIARVSRGFAALTPRIRSDAAALAQAAAPALSKALGEPVAIEAWAAPAPAEGVTGVARVGIALACAGGEAILEVEARLLAHVLGRLTGRAGGPIPPPLAASEHELALLALGALVVIGVARDHGLGRLSPLVALEDPPALAPAGCLAIHLDLCVGASTGGGRLLVPVEAIRALESAPTLADDVARLLIGASLRDGSVTLTPDELAAISPGDVLLLDPPSGTAALVLPGGLTFCGRWAAGVHHVEEIRMTEAQASYPVVLSVEIGRVQLTVAQLARLAPGAALPLDLRKDASIVLRAGDEVVARGELVDVEGSLGIRVAQVGGLR